MILLDFCLNYRSEFKMQLSIPMYTFKWSGEKYMSTHRCKFLIEARGGFFLAYIDFNPSMDKQSYAQ